MKKRHDSDLLLICWVTVVFMLLLMTLVTLAHCDTTIVVAKKVVHFDGLTCNLSLANGVAFITNPSTDLSPHIGGKITLTDSAGKKAVGYIKAAGTGETYGDELISNGGFDSETGWTLGAGWSIADGVATANPTNANITQLINLTAGWCLKESFDLTSYTAGYAYWYNAGVSPAYGTVTRTLESKSWYKTMTLSGSRAIGLTASSTSRYSADNRSSKQVLTPSATGVTITSTPGGTTYNWASVESGFNYNEISYDAIITGAL